MGSHEEDEKKGESRNVGKAKGYLTTREAKSLGTSLGLSLSDPATGKTVLPNLKHPAFNIANAIDPEMYSK